MKLPEQIVANRIVLNGLKTPSFELAKQIYDAVEKSRERLREWLPWVDKTHSAEDEFSNFLVEWCKVHWENDEGFAYLIVSKETEEVLGCIDIFKVSEESKNGEIGFWLSDGAEGKGYMREAVLALEAEAFKAGINRIVIKNDTQNSRSMRVAEQCGYVLEGVMRQDAWDEYHQRLRDTNVWAKLKADWEKM